MEKARLSRMERKILFALHNYGYATIGYRELNGYLHFPPALDIGDALQNLQSLGLIREVESPYKDRPGHYVATHAGKEWLQFRPSKSPVIRKVVEIVFTALIAAVINRLFGLLG